MKEGPGPGLRRYLDLLEAEAPCRPRPIGMMSGSGSASYLPDGSGLDLMRRRVEEGKAVPAIALSGHGTADDNAKSKAAGCLEHLVKPMSSIEALLAALRRISKGSAAGGCAGRAGPGRR